MNPKPDIALGLVLGSIGLGFAYHATQYQGQSAIFPLGIGIGTALLSAVLILRSAGAIVKGAATAPFTLVEDYAGFLVIVASAIAFALLVTRLGFFMTSIAYSFIVPWILGYRRISTLLICCAVFNFALYLLFVVFLGYPLPRGVLF